MTCIIAYDIAENRVRNKMARFLLKIGARLQKSVFAVQVERRAFKKLTKKLETMTEKKGKIVIIRLCAGCQKKAIQLDEEAPQFYIF